MYMSGFTLIILAALVLYLSGGSNALCLNYALSWYGLVHAQSPRGKKKLKKKKTESAQS